MSGLTHSTLTLVKQWLNGELVIRSLNAILKGGDIALLAEAVGSGIHGFDLAHVALLKTPIGYECQGQGARQGIGQHPLAGQDLYPPRGYSLANHVLDTLLDLGKGYSLGTVVEHAHNGVHASEHLSQHLVLVG